MSICNCGSAGYATVYSIGKVGRILHRWLQHSWPDDDCLGIHCAELFIQTARKISKGRKIARIAPIWTKIWQNRSQRLKLSFEKVFRATKLQKQCFQDFFARVAVRINIAEGLWWAFASLLAPRTLIWRLPCTVDGTYIWPFLQFKPIVRKPLWLTRLSHFLFSD